MAEDNEMCIPKKYTVIRTFIGSCFEIDRVEGQNWVITVFYAYRADCGKTDKIKLDKFYTIKGEGWLGLAAEVEKLVQDGCFSRAHFLRELL